MWQSDGQLPYTTRNVADAAFIGFNDHSTYRWLRWTGHRADGARHIHGREGWQLHHLRWRRRQGRAVPGSQCLL
ncbi:hypothetical protein EMIT0P294_30563 [Pseudomonas sp. IT-P294]